MYVAPYLDLISAYRKLHVGWYFTMTNIMPFTIIDASQLHFPWGNSRRWLQRFLPEHFLSSSFCHEASKAQYES